jgi:hypothetical protein
MRVQINIHACLAAVSGNLYGLGKLPIFSEQRQNPGSGMNVVR